MSEKYPRALRSPFIAAIVALVGAGCGLDKQAMPALSGPSGLGLAITMTASPDHLPRDGNSQSVVTLSVRDSAGQGVANRRVAVSVTPGALLTQSEVVTGPGGQATFGVIAPNSTTVMVDNQIELRAVPLGDGDAGNAMVRVATIGLTGIPNGMEPRPDFTVNPQAPEINQVVTFDASSTIDENKPCLAECTYDWDFDDGALASGRVVAHAFAVGRPYNVALTVTDASGVMVTLRKVVMVAAPQAPKVEELKVVPEPAVVNRVVTFITTATAAPNHSVIRYEWSFGDGATATTTSGTVDHTYTVSGTFAVTVRAIDDLGQVGAVSKSVPVGSGIRASFTISPADPVLGQTVNVDASASTSPSGTTIATYSWNWGDGNSESSSSPTAAHNYASKNTWTVTLTITDSQGGVGSTTGQIVIK